MKKILLIVSAIVMALAIPISIFLVKNQQDIRTKAAPATTLSLTPALLTKAIDETFTLDATIETGSNQVFVAELHISYDPTKLEAISITNGPLFPNIIISGQIDPSGMVSITLGSENQLTPVVGTGIAATIKFKAVGATSAPTLVQFSSPDTFVGAKEEGATNVLIGTVPSKITITSSENETAGTGGAVLTPTPTRASTLSPTPTTQPDNESTSALIILSPSETIPSTTTRPIFKGEAPANASITLVLLPSGETVSINANQTGFWTYTPIDPLEVGPQEVTVTALDPETQETQTVTQSFVIAATTGDDSVNGTPVSGDISITILIVMLSLGLIGFGLFIPSAIHIK